ncbi:MAG: tryptophan synthase subunit alpha, partial [Gammaproteobacteria bacterium]|nr:tryptophan synthase subunit alpha [Gammaproteobacteria bacterium]
DPIFIFSPNTTDERLAFIAQYARGFVYCVARKGVTGSDTQFSRSLGGYLQRCRAATNLPLAVGFGVKEASDVAFLHGKADIAVVGSQSLRVLDERGVPAVGEFVAGLV